MDQVNMAFVCEDSRWTGSAKKLDSPIVSVIVPTKNSTSTIIACLKSLRVQTYPAVQIIVVDNESNDNTPELVAPLVDTMISVPGLRTVVRNAGAQVAYGEMLLFIDSDMILPPSTIEFCMKMMREGADGAILPERNLVRGYWMRAYSFHKNRSPQVAGSVRLIRKSIFDEVGGYDETLDAGEDFELHYRVIRSGARIVTVKEVLIDHDITRASICDIVRKHRYYASTLDRFYATAGGDYAKFRRPLSERIRLLRSDIVQHPLEFGGWMVLQVVLKTQLMLTLSLKSNGKRWRSRG